MPDVQTLAGPLDTGSLGRVLMHEHIFNVSADVQICFPGFNGWDPEVQIPRAREKLRELKEAGYDTLVELSVLGLGRSLDMLVKYPLVDFSKYQSLPLPTNYDGPLNTSSIGGFRSAKI